MDIDEIRRANILLLQDEAGSPKAAAERVGLTYSGFLNYRNGAKDSETGKKRGMRKQTAWRFEEAFGKPRGWLDQDHSRYAPHDADAAFVRQVQESVAVYAVPQHVKQTILMLINQSPRRPGADDTPINPAKAA